MRTNRGDEDLNTLLGSGKDMPMSIPRGNVGSYGPSVSGKSITQKNGTNSNQTATGKGSEDQGTPLTTTNVNSEGFSDTDSESKSKFNNLDNARAQGQSGEARVRPGFSKERTTKGTSG